MIHPMLRLINPSATQNTGNRRNDSQTHESHTVETFSKVQGFLGDCHLVCRLCDERFLLAPTAFPTSAA
jgi:hypothetical protein